MVLLPVRERGQFQEGFVLLLMLSLNVGQTASLPIESRGFLDESLIDLLDASPMGRELR